MVHAHCICSSPVCSVLQLQYISPTVQRKSKEFIKSCFYCYQLLMCKSERIFGLDVDLLICLLVTVFKLESILGTA